MIFMIVFLVGGLIAAVLSVLGIVLLAKRYSAQDDGGKVLMVIGIIFLTLFGLAGLFSLGCSAIFLLSP